MTLEERIQMYLNQGYSMTDARRRAQSDLYNDYGNSINQIGEELKALEQQYASRRAFNERSGGLVDPELENLKSRIDNLTKEKEGYEKAREENNPLYTEEMKDAALNMYYKDDNKKEPLEYREPESENKVTLALPPTLDDPTHPDYQIKDYERDVFIKTKVAQLLAAGLSEEDALSQATELSKNDDEVKKFIIQNQPSIAETKQSISAEATQAAVDETKDNEKNIEEATTEALEYGPVDPYARFLVEEAHKFATIEEANTFIREHEDDPSYKAARSAWYEKSGVKTQAAIADEAEDNDKNIEEATNEALEYGPVDPYARFLVDTAHKFATIEEANAFIQEHKDDISFQVARDAWSQKFGQKEKTVNTGNNDKEELYGPWPLGAINAVYPNPVDPFEPSTPEPVRDPFEPSTSEPKKSDAKSSDEIPASAKASKKEEKAPSGLVERFKKAWKEDKKRIIAYAVAIGLAVGATAYLVVNALTTGEASSAGQVSDIINGASNGSIVDIVQNAVKDAAQSTDISSAGNAVITDQVADAVNGVSNSAAITAAGEAVNETAQAFDLNAIREGVNVHSNLTDALNNANSLPSNEWMQGIDHIEAVDSAGKIINLDGMTPEQITDQLANGDYGIRAYQGDTAMGWFDENTIVDLAEKQGAVHK